MFTSMSIDVPSLVESTPPPQYLEKFPVKESKSSLLGRNIAPLTLLPFSAPTTKSNRRQSPLPRNLRVWARFSRPHVLPGKSLDLI